MDTYPIGSLIKGVETSTGRRPRVIWTVILPGHYEANAAGALQLIAGGSHEATGYSIDWARTQLRKAGF